MDLNIYDGERMHCDVDVKDEVYVLRAHYRPIKRSIEHVYHDDNLCPFHAEYKSVSDTIGMPRGEVTLTYTNLGFARQAMRKKINRRRDKPNCVTLQHLKEFRDYEQKIARHRQLQTVSRNRYCGDPENCPLQWRFNKVIKICGDSTCAVSARMGETRLLPAEGIKFRPHTLQALAVAAYLKTHPSKEYICNYLLINPSFFWLFFTTLVSTQDGYDLANEEFESMDALTLAISRDLSLTSWSLYTNVRLMCPCQQQDPIHKCALRRRFKMEPRYYFGHRTDCLREY